MSPCPAGDQAELYGRYGCGVIATMAACSIGHVEFPESACALVDLSALNEHLRLQSIEEGRHFEPMLFIVGMPLIQLADWDFDFPAATWAVARAA